MLPMAVNKDDVRKDLQEAFQAATGMKLEVQGTPEFKVSLLPYISIDSLYVINTPDATSPFLLTIKHANIWPSITTLFHGKAGIRKVELTGVNIDAEVLSGGRLNWQEVSSYWDKGIFQTEKMKNEAVSGAMNVVVLGGQLHYSNSLTGAAATLDNVNAVFDADPAGKAGANIRLNYRNRPYTVAASVKGNLMKLFTTDTVPVDVNATSGQSNFTYAGTAGYKNNRSIFNGDIKLDTDDLAYWIDLYHNEEPADNMAGYKKLPVSATAKLTMANPAKMVFSDIALSGTTIQGRAQADVNLVASEGKDIANLNPAVSASVKAAIDTMDLDGIVTNGFLLRGKNEHNEQAGVMAPAHAANPVSITGDITIKDMVYNNKHIRNASVSVSTTGDDMMVPQCIATLPGDTRLDFSGIGHSGVHGLTVEGQVDVEGSSLVELLTLFKTNSITLPSNDFRRFHMRANALASSKEVMLSELVARVENMVINGGLNVKLDNRASLQAALGIRGLNIDNIAALWGLQSLSGTLLSRNDLGDQKEGAISVWLKKLGYDMLVSTSLQNYTLNGKSYDQANLTISAAEGKIEMTALKVPYQSSVVSGRMGINVSGKTPEFDIHALVDTLNLDTLFPKTASGSQGNTRWSNDLLNFSWMELLKGTYDIRFGHLTYGNIEADDVSMVGTLADQKMNVESLKANALGSGISGKFTLTGGAIPTFSGAANILGLRLEKAASLLPALNGVAGVCNMSVSLNTNGISAMSWMSNMQGGVSVSGRNIEVRGFNLPGIIRAVAYVRTVADILNAVERAVPGGNTLFNTLEAQWNVSKGTLETLNARVTNSQADGAIVSKLDLINWTSNTAITFALKALDPVNMPKILVKVTGNIDQPKLDFDTSALEQYVNNKTSERMLHDYGAH